MPPKLRVAERLTAPPELASYLEGLEEPHIVFDRRYRIVAANAAYRRQYSPSASVLGRTCYEVSHRFAVPCDQAGESCPFAKTRESGQRERVLHLHHTPQGEAYIDIELTPLADASGEAVLFVERMAPLRTAQGQPAQQGLIGRSPAFREMLEQVARVAPSEASVLLLGESGTGKELVARAVHEASERAAQALVVVDCASLPETLFEAEVFGHERGAFTGATTTRTGLAETANGGTLFLDEVGDIPLAMQVKLLRLLESGTFRRVGSSELRRTDVRVVAATHRDLGAMVADGRFREDLYYRLATFPIRLPPLREREGDLALLAEALLARVAPKRRLALSPAALARLAGHRFPGNVRELRNVLERAALFCDGPVLEALHVERALAAGLPLSRPALAVEAPARSLREISRQALRERLAAHGGRRADLARELGISERTLYRRLRELDTPEGEPR
ncbi:MULTISPECIES: sigma-54-dependent Fis family transcriptional regulator [unclassified Rubrivivax]|uniref:sigma-54 interaction domain-containing protein n=1 Tax=unclassified Rubrivivax TaxID=2649762 RepID=UPI001E3289F7|nr:MULTISPECIES: sigma-54-dependent Fis family transcriptional regulator [unclassified Rubrivivax]MCC9597202.1 sigma-54-dependent Fis family transcriptional regulator [Rubrivivax sp. JA1055]MCC9646539.1 sigma-54-dependent Fis family transcriptional regulator [Rubrivivax sp. JA1029]MCD0416824.1 sigma-54-dependent Fis family transcriptional regulator [Rubrivivax sp. JA1024]